MVKWLYLGRHLLISRGSGGWGSFRRGHVIYFNPARWRAENFNFLSHVYIEQFLK